jgi:hypothetical protein
MERRGFIKFGIIGLAASVVSILAGCSKPAESVPKLANQEKLWQAANAEKVKEPVDLSYAKKTPALFKDASFGKEDGSFTPKVGGG